MPRLDRAAARQAIDGAHGDRSDAARECGARGIGLSRLASARRTRGARKQTGARRAPRTGPAAAPAIGRRLAPDERSRQIVRGAVRYFAEKGFSGTTRELARRLGITQPLLYRYFPSKADLIDRVYEEVFLARWKPQWEALLDDTTRPLQERLLAFYLDYAQAMLQPDWIRILMYSGLDGANVATRLLSRLRTLVFARVIRAVRADQGASLDAAQFTELEYELVWALHASIFYLGIRRWIYGLAPRENIETLVTAAVRSFLHGAPAVMQSARDDDGAPVGKRRNEAGGKPAERRTSGVAAVTGKPARTSAVRTVPPAHRA